MLICSGTNWHYHCLKFLFYQMIRYNFRHLIRVYLIMTLDTIKMFRLIGYTPHPFMVELFLFIN